MGHFLYHWIYQDFYQPVWPNIAASITVGAWVIWRNRLHIERLEKSMVHRFGIHASLMGRELGNIHAHLSDIHSTVHHSTGNVDSDPSLSAQSEVEGPRVDPS